MHIFKNRELWEYYTYDEIAEKTTVNKFFITSISQNQFFGNRN